jgi:hypothetical protein
MEFDIQWRAVAASTPARAGQSEGSANLLRGVPETCKESAAFGQNAPLIHHHHRIR